MSLYNIVKHIKCEMFKNQTFEKNGFRSIIHPNYKLDNGSYVNFYNAINGMCFSDLAKNNIKILDSI